MIINRIDLAREDRVMRIADRDFQIMRRHAWEWADRRMRWQRLERRVLWPIAGLLAIAGLWEVLRW